MGEDWRNNLEAWLTRFVGALGHKTRGRMCPAYVAGLIGLGDRKSVQPMAARDGSVRYDRLHHIAASEMQFRWRLRCMPTRRSSTRRAPRNPDGGGGSTRAHCTSQNQKKSAMSPPLHKGSESHLSPHGYLEGSVRPRGTEVRA